MFGNRFRYLTKEGFRNIRVNRLMSLASVTVLMSCLVIIGCAMLIYFNVNTILDNVESQNIVMVFVKDDATAEDEQVLYNDIMSTDNIAACEFVSRDDGYAEILSDMGTDAEVMTNVDSQFLPDSYRITVKDMSMFSQTVETLKGLPNVIGVRETASLPINSSRSVLR